MNKIFFTLLIFFSVNVQSQIIVSKTRGSDGNPGTDAFPVATIKRGVDICPVNGLVLIEPGEYQESVDIVVARSMTIQSRFALGSVTINAQNRSINTTGKSIFKIQNVNNVIVKGIRMKNLIGNGSNAVYITQSGNAISVLNCNFENIGWKSNDLVTPASSNSVSVSAIKVEGYNPTAISNILIRKDTIFNCAVGYGEAITITGNVDGFTIDSNLVHHIANIGIDAAGNYLIGTQQITTTYRSKNGKILNNEVFNCMSPIAPSAAIYLDNSESCIVDGNKCYQSGVGISIGGEQPSTNSPGNHTIRNNVIYENCITGIDLGCLGNLTIKNVVITNNTLFKNRSMSSINGVQSINGIGTLDNNSSAVFGGEVTLKSCDNISFYNNNIHRRSDRRAMYIQPGRTVNNFQSRYNNYKDDGSQIAVFFSIDGASLNGVSATISYQTLANFTSAWPSLEINTTELYSSFVDSTNRLLKLLPSSPLINKGDPNSTTAISGLKDFDGADRIICARIDIGAYELNAVPATPSITPSGNVSFCSGQALLTSSASSGNQWFLNGTAISGATSNTYTPVQNGTYTVTFNNGSCTSLQSAGAVVIIVSPPMPSISVTGNTTFCQGGSVLLTSNVASGNQWYQNGNIIAGATNSSYTATATGSYTVKVTQSGCQGQPSTAVNVTVNPIPGTPSISPSGNISLCNGAAAILTSSATTGNQWYRNGTLLAGETNNTYSVTTSGNYTVMSTINGCQSAASSPVIATVNPIPNTPIITAAGNTTFCQGGSVLLTSSTASGNQWYQNGSLISGATNNSYTVTTTGSYTVRVTQNGCQSQASAAANVTVNPIPATPTITPTGNVSLCNGETVLLTSSAASGNQWYRNGTLLPGATSNSYTVSTSGNYTVISTINSCQSAASSPVVAVINPIPNAPAITAASGTSFCQGGSVVLNSNIASGNQWYKGATPINGATNNNLIVTEAGVYSAKVTILGCTSSSSNNIPVTVYPSPPVPPISLQGLGLVTTSGYAAYKWYLNNIEIIGATSNLYRPVADGIYKVKVFDANGCSNTSLDTSFTLRNGVVVEGRRIRLLPNPASTQAQLIVSGNGNGKLVYTIYNNIGQNITSLTGIELRNGVNNILVDNLPNGVYTIWIIGINETKTLRLIIK